MKSKKVVLLIGLLFIAIAGLGTMLIRAWLTDTDNTGDVTLTVGTVEFTLSGEFESDYIVPGQELIKTKYTLKNTSNIPTQVRVKLTVTSQVAGGDTANLYTFTPANGWILSDGYYYYGGTELNPTTGEVITSTQTIDLTGSLKLNGATVGNAHQGKTFTFKFEFQAKQAANVDWADMGSIDFTTGLAS